MKIRRRHINHAKFWGFMVVMAFLPPWLWWIAMLSIWVFMFLFAFGLLGLLSPMPSAKVLTALGKRRVMMGLAPTEEAAP